MFLVMECAECAEGGHSYSCADARSLYYWWVDMAFLVSSLKSRLHTLDVDRIKLCSVWLTGTCPLMMTSSAKRTLTGLVFSLAFLAALMNADLGDFRSDKRKNSRGQWAISKMSHDFYTILYNWRTLFPSWRLRFLYSSPAIRRRHVS